MHVIYSYELDQLLAHLTKELYKQLHSENKVLHKIFGAFCVDV